MHLIIFIHLTALYCRLPSASSAPNKNVEAHPLFQHFSLNQDPVCCGRSQKRDQRLPFCFFNSARASSQEGNPKRTGERRNCIYLYMSLLNMSKICCNKDIQDQRNLRICIWYHLRYEVDKYEWTFNPRALVHDVWSVWLQDQNIIGKPTRFNQSLNDHIWVPRLKIEK